MPNAGSGTFADDRATTVLFDGLEAATSHPPAKKVVRVQEIQPGAAKQALVKHQLEVINRVAQAQFGAESYAEPLIGGSLFRTLSLQKQEQIAGLQHTVEVLRPGSSTVYLCNLCRFRAEGEPVVLYQHAQTPEHVLSYLVSCFYARITSCSSRKRPTPCTCRN